MSRWKIIVGMLLGLFILGLYYMYPTFIFSPVLGFCCNLQWDALLVLVLFAILIVLWVKEIYPPEISAFSIISILTIAQVLQPKDFVKGFAQESIFTIILLSIVSKALEVNGVVRFFVQKNLIHRIPSSLNIALLLIPVALLSSVLNNTPLVLIMTPIISQWLNEHQMYSSKCLMAMSFLTILGGMCTLMGTSTNLIIQGLLIQTDKDLGFSFFELSQVGLPCLFVGGAYILFSRNYMLPERSDPLMQLAKDPKRIVGEFLIESGCEWEGLTVERIGRDYLQGAVILEVLINNRVYESPSPRMSVPAGARIDILGPTELITSLHTIEHLRSMSDPDFNFDSNSLHLSEIVIASQSRLIGKTLKQVRFRQNFNASVAAIYRKGKRLRGALSDHLLLPGDVLVILSPGEWSIDPSHIGDCYIIRSNHRVRPPKPKNFFGLLAIVVSMITFGSMTNNIFVAALGAVVAMAATNIISIREIRQGIPWSLVLLLGSCFSLGVAIQETQLLSSFSFGLLSILGNDPYWLLAGLFLITLLLTEFISNSAAAFLLFPLGIQLFSMAGFVAPSTYKAIGACVAIAASCSFLSPIGYQTNTIVYGPGGYRFYDFARFGWPLTLIIFTISMLLIPKIWIIQ